MRYKLWTRYEPCMVKIVVKTKSPQNIIVKVFDAGQANTYFTNRNKIVDGVQDLYVRMPLSPGTCAMSIYNEKNGDLPKDKDDSFEVLDIKKEELDITLPKTKMDTPLVRNFVAFAQKFSYNAGWISTNKDYVSSMGNFKIEYLPQIISSKGEKMATPARISTKNGRIQVSQQAFLPFTIPMRMAILLHEFSHFYVNSDIANETEADLNGLTIYLGLGYPIKEAYTAFGETFIGYPSEQNKMRYDIIDKFIKDYIAEYNIKDVYATGK
jgi:hypothetical protein